MDSAANLLNVLFRLSPMSVLPLFDEEIADGAHRLLVKNAQSQEAGEWASAHGTLCRNPWR